MRHFIFGNLMNKSFFSCIKVTTLSTSLRKGKLDGGVVKDFGFGIKLCLIQAPSFYLGKLHHLCSSSVKQNKTKPRFCTMKIKWDSPYKALGILSGTKQALNMLDIFIIHYNIIHGHTLAFQIWYQNVQ